MNKDNQYGFSLISVVVMISVIFSISVAAVSLAIRQAEKVNLINQESKAYLLAKYGLEKVVKLLENDDDWSDNGGTIFNNVAYLGGTYTVVNSSAATHSITIASTGQYQDLYKTIEKDLERTTNTSSQIPDEYYVSISTANSRISGANKKLIGTTISNSHSTRNITIEEIIVAWYSSGGQICTTIKTGGSNSWTGSQGSGTVFNISDYSLLAGTSGIEVQLFFDSDMTSKIFSLYFRYSDGSSSHIDFNPNTGGSHASFLTIDTSSVNVSGAGDDEVLGIDLINTSPTYDIYFDSIDISWFYDSPSRNITKIKFDTATIWTGSSASGAEIDFSNYTLSAGDTKELMLYFSGDINYRRFSFTFNMTDESSQSATADFTIIQNTYLDFDNTSAEISGSTDLEGMELSNTHGEASIWIDKVLVNLSPNNSQKIEEIYLNDVQVFSGSANQNTDINVTVTSITAGQSISHKIYFDNSIENTTINATYTLIDETTKANQLNPSTSPAQNTLFSITTRDVIITDYRNPDDLEQLKLHNTSSYNYTITHIKPTWAPDNSEVLQSISINGSSVWTGTESSGALIDITDTAINSGQENREQICQFNTDMVNIDFTFEYTFSDATTINSNIVLNSASVIGGDNFESGGLSGGNGFSGAWSKTGTVSAYNSNDVYSGGYYLRFRNNSLAKRNIDLSSYSSAKVKFYLEVSGYDSGDIAYFDISDDGEVSWQNIASWNTDTSGYNYYEYDLSSYDLDTDFYIRFRSECNQNNDYLRVDEIYLYE
ncbi:hypothetical protein ACFL2K_03050 [Candidatus Margulisiibacteriota bacterium]